MKLTQKIGVLIGLRAYGHTGATGGWWMGARDEEGTAANSNSLPNGKSAVIRAFMTLQLSPQASLAEIEEAYDRLQNTWRSDRYPNDRWREESTQKLKQIREAYDRVLLTKQEESKGPAPEPPQTAPSGSSTPATPFEKLQAPIVENPDFERPRKRFQPKVRRQWIVVAMLLVVAAGCVLFLWPGMYYYDSFKVGNKIYPLRIHILTAQATYFDGDSWIAPPINERPSAQPPTGIPPVAVAITPTVPDAAPPSTGPVQPAPPSPPLPDLNLTDPPSVPATAPVTLPDPAARIASGKSATPGSFSIQIRAFRDEDEATAFLQQLGVRRSRARIEKVSLEGSGVWYRILLQSFASRSKALKHLREDPFFTSYPGSFVQEAHRDR